MYARRDKKKGKGKRRANCCDFVDRNAWDSRIPPIKQCHFNQQLLMPRIQQYTGTPNPKYLIKRRGNLFFFLPLPRPNFQPHAMHLDTYARINDKIVERQQSVDTAKLYRVGRRGGGSTIFNRIKKLPFASTPIGVHCTESNASVAATTAKGAATKSIAKNGVFLILFRKKKKKGTEKKKRKEET